MKFEIIKAEQHMAIDIATVHIASWQDAYESIIPKSFLDKLSIEKRARRYRFDADLGKDHHFYVAKLKGEIIGFFHLCPCMDEDIENAGEISSIYLLPQYWNMGYGSSMMDYAMDLLLKKTYKQIVIWALEKNIQASHFYKKHSFNLDGSKKTMEIGKKLIAVRYIKEVDSN